MKIKELIAELSKHPSDVEVFFAVDKDNKATAYPVFSLYMQARVEKSAGGYVEGFKNKVGIEKVLLVH